jgi:N-acetylglucosamine-6-phosphate deacetylase
MVAGIYRPGDVDVDASGGRIAAVGLAGPGRGLAIPGLIDLQVNGFAGVDFQQAQADDYRPAAAALARSGVLAFQPTLITGAPGRMLAALDQAAKAQAHRGGARILGVHLEGPFLSPRRSGTHPIDLLRSPGPALARQLLDAGPVTEITIAPELPGALRLIDLAVRRGVLVSLGHSDATAEHAHAVLSGCSCPTPGVSAPTGGLSGCTCP